MSYIFGRKPIVEAIRSGERIDHIYIQHGLKGQPVFEIQKLAKERGIRVSEISTDRLNALLPGKNTQGVVGVTTDIQYVDIDNIISKAKTSQYPLIVILDSIQDPHNVGAILRSAECAGADGIIITRHNSASVNDTVIKTSAGATSHLSICVVNNLAQSLDMLKENGFWIAGSYLEGAKSYTEIDYKLPLALIVGNEEKGIRRLTADKCDFLVKIPMKGKIQSLNVSVATGILLFEINRQRDKN